VRLINLTLGNSSQQALQPGTFRSAVLRRAIFSKLPFIFWFCILLCVM
jgi:hypothetical protein